MASDVVLRIGTRGSPLALAQAAQTRSLLATAHGISPERIEILVFTTSGDTIRDRPLSEVGGKGLFTKELEQALSDRSIDLAVHSAKDMATALPDGLAIAAALRREDPRDALIAPGHDSLATLPTGAVVGTASLRRQAMLRRVRPDLDIILFRGNVETRLGKIRDGRAHATLLAYAGLKRLALTGHASAILSPEAFVPAAGQGIIALESRADDRRTRELALAIDHPDSSLALAAERAFLGVLDGSCRTPIGGYAEVSGETIRFRGIILKPDGSEAHETERAGSVGDAVRLGAEAGAELKARGGPDFFVPL